MKVSLKSITPNAEINIVEIARVSSSRTDKTEKPEGLINYLIKNKHWSPFEHSYLTFDIVTSKAIGIQLLRHVSCRFQELCLSGNSMITLSLPSGSTYKRPISKLYELQFKPNQHIKNNGLPLARIFDGEKFSKARIKQVFKTGKKIVFEVKLSDGKKIKCTKEHKFLTKEGYKPLEDIVGLGVTSSNKAYMTKVGVVGVNGIPLHQSKEWLENAKTNCINNKTGVLGISELANVSYNTIRKWLRIHNLQFTKKEVSLYTEIWNKNKFGYKNKPHTLEAIEKMRKSARKGKDSNLWKGGSDRSERLKIADWCGSIRAEKLIEYNYKCKNCSCSKNLELDHIIPVYQDKTLAYSKDNIQVLCNVCHDKKHNINGDIKIWREKSKAGFLTLKWCQIESVTYIGEEETYDIEIDHETHNYVANGIIVHNSQRYQVIEKLEPCDFRLQAEKNRQSSTNSAFFVDLDNIRLSDNKYASLATKVSLHFQQSLSLYKELLDAGIARECARFILPMCTSTNIYMTGSIRSWIHILEVRDDSHAQLEIQDLAKEIKKIFVKELPIISKALDWGV